MNSHTRSILIGMVWGDGCIKPKLHTLKDGKETKYYEFVVGHTSKQEAYITHKRDVFHSQMRGKEPKLYRRKFLLNGTEHEEIRFSRQHKYFALLYRWMYPYGKKTYTRRILDYMNASSIAYWYMDDGGVSKAKRKDGTVSSVEMRLATYCSEEETDIIIAYFSEVWDIAVKKRLHKKTNKWYLAFNTKESKKLEVVIHPYIIDSMKYKLPSNYVTRAQDTLIMGEDIV